MGRLSAARRLRSLRDHLCAGAAAAEPPRLIRGQGGDSHHEAVDAGEDLPPTPLELYQFDLNGCEPPSRRRAAASSCCTLDPDRSCTDIIIKGAVSKAEVDRLNAHLDALPRPRMGEWIGRAHVTATGGSGRAHGAQIQQCYELGGPFEELVDQCANPSARPIMAPAWPARPIPWDRARALTAAGPAAAPPSSARSAASSAPRPATEATAAGTITPTASRPSTKPSSTSAASAAPSACTVQ